VDRHVGKSPGAFIGELACKAAQACLAGSRYKPSEPVRLSRLSKWLGISEQRTFHPSHSVRGSLWTHLAPLGFEAGARIEVGIPNSRPGLLRFTVAHELAHQYARLYLPSEVTQVWSARDVRRFCHEFAAHVLLPASLLESALCPFVRASSLSVAPGGPPRLRLQIRDIEGLCRRLRVPMVSLLIRLHQMAMRREVALEFCALEVAARTSQRRMQNYAPRLLASCTPREWFLPANKRLSTLGFTNLAAAFWTSPPLAERVAYDRFTVWLRDGWRHQQVEGEIRYKVYPGSGGTRVMLAILVLPGSPWVNR
jgi:hypothetical protein